MEGFANASLWVIEDVTEARKAEAALREIHERLELAQEAGKIGVFDVDLRSGRILWSSKLSVMMGFPLDKQPLSRDEWLACLHPQDRQRARDHFDACINGTQDSVRDSWRVVRQDGEVRWFLEAARIFRDEAGKATRVVGVNVDIHDQKQLEAQVAAQLDFQQALIDAIPVPLFYKGADGRYTGFNRAYEQAFGVKRSDFIGKTVQELAFLPEELRMQFRQDADEALGGQPDSAPRGGLALCRWADSPHVVLAARFCAPGRHTGWRHRHLCGHHRSQTGGARPVARERTGGGIDGAQVQLPGQHEP